MKNTWMKKGMSMLMALCLIIGMIPMSAFATEDTDTQTEEEAVSEITYSDKASVNFEETAPVYQETDGSKELNLSRAGNVKDALTVTVQIYDNSANYGMDYLIKLDGTEIEKIEGATSIYDAFRDGGQLVSNLPVDAAEAYVTYDESAETEESVSAADMLAQIQDLGAMAAEFEVTFPAGEAKVPLTVEIIDDSFSEYDESFMAVILDDEGEVFEAGQILCSIIDDEEDPTVHVAFDCEDVLIADEESGMAQITFKRTGNLATGTAAVLLYDGEPMGYVDFSPHQDTQVVLALPGTYTLMSDGGYTVSEEMVTVSLEEKEIPEGADPELDAVPAQYDVISPVRQVSNTNWFPDWAKKYTSTYEDDSSIIVMGSSSNGLFEYDDSSTDGSLSFVSDKNMYKLNTEGGSSSGYLYSRTKSKYNLTGIESIEGTVYIEDLTTGYCDVIFGVWNVGHYKLYENDNKSTQNLKYTLADNYQGSKYIYYCNSDLPGSWDCGWNAYTPNGFKMNKRTYRIRIEAPEALDYNGYSIAPALTSGSTTMYYTMDADRHINLAYSCDSAYPAKLVGYQLKNGTKWSDTISLSQDYITFDQSFLGKYESSWCYDDSDGYNTFTIRPVFAKIEVEYELQDAALGTIAIQSPSGQNLHQGDKVVFTGTGKDGATFTGVHYEKRQSANGDILEYGVIGKVGDTVTMDLSGSKYSHYTFQGVFDTNSDQLYVEYKDPQNVHGILYTEGLALDKDTYDVSNYYPLKAKADDGYITVWESNGRTYYGDTFNYQLDGNANNNTITVDFVKESDVTLSTGTISGYLSRKDTNLLNGTSADIVLANSQYVMTVSQDNPYAGSTDENGYFEIQNFKGVVGGSYSMAVSYQDKTGYVTFTYNGPGKYSLSLPQFVAGSFYPVEVVATVDGVGYNQNYIYLTSAGAAEFVADIYVHSDIYKITKVTYHFLSNLSDSYGDELKTMEAVYDSTINLGDKHEAWKLSLNDNTALPKDTHLYVTVTAEMTYTYTDSNGTQTETTEITTDLVNTGYNLAEPIIEDVTPIQQDIPEVPGVQNSETDTSLLDIPIIGTLDMSVTSKTGGYFIQTGSWKEAGDTYTLVCGHSITPNYGTGTLQDKYKDAVGTKDLLEGASSDDPKGAADLKQKSATQVEIAPVFYLKFTVQTADDGNGGLIHYLTGFEFALGIFGAVKKNIPFTVYGVPCYVCITLTTEAYIQLQMNLPEGTQLGAVLTTIVEDATTDVNAFFAAPILKFGVKGGVGYNNWASIFAEGTIEAPFTVDFTPVDAAGQISWDVGIGVDLMAFSAEIEYNSNPYDFGNETLLANLKTIQDLQENTSALQSYRLSSGKSYETLEEALENATFSAKERPEQSTQVLRSGTMTSDTIASGVFMNTEVQLVQLDSGKIMVLFLTDNHAEDGSLNYLSAAYSISSDGGKTWSEVDYVSENIGEATTSLQYDINVFELEDRILVTWSEANLDKVLGDIDLENITADQIAKAMNAMSLKGRFFDKNSGEAMGEAFAIAQNSTVFCGGLEAVQNGDMVYVYYQRNVFPTEEDVTVEDLLSNERTIAMASANVNDTENWTSTPVRAMSKDGKQYRIVDVVPFVHDGILGEVAVLDQNGRLTVTNEETGELEADIEDRQIYLRTYEFDEDGVPTPTALIALTDYNDCAQSPQVLSTDDYLYMMWNQNGEVVYMSDFVARDTDSEEVQDQAYVVANADGTYTVKTPEETGVATVASDESVYIGTRFTASIADDGNVMVSWVATDKEDTTLVPTDEIYGMMLESKEEGLYAVGSPVALTDEDRPIGALDNICMENEETSKFLLVYSRFNEMLRRESTSADIMTQTSVDEPKLAVTVDALDYPLPGTTVNVDLTISNEGFETLNGAAITVSGIGETLNLTVEDEILSGRSKDVTVELTIPEDFDETTDLKVTVSGLGNQAKYTASGETEVLYGSYIVPMDLPQITSIPNSTDCLVQIPVRNNGNASGTVTLDLKNQVFASDKAEDVKEYTFESDVVVSANGEATISYLMEDTLMDAEIYSTVQVWTGEAYDQGTEAPMPKPVTLSLEDVSYGNNGDDTNKPDVSVDADSPSSGDNSQAAIYIIVLIGAVMCLGVVGMKRFKKRF